MTFFLTPKMARRQRGVSASSKKAADAGSAEGPNMVAESSDEDAPEEVTFADSKSEALRRLKDALEAERREKEQLKEKRKRRHELFQEQKKRKLPADVLEEIDSALSPSHEQPEAEEEPLSDEGPADVGRSKLPHVRKLKGSYTVKAVGRQEASDFRRQAAEDFIQSRLYGAGSCRSSSSEMLSLQNKRAKKKSAAVNFVRKDWAREEKIKAEKLKKRWIHKQMAPPTS